MKNKILRIRKWMCRKFGHTFDEIELVMLDIKQNSAINKKEFQSETILCKRCGVPCSFME